MLSTRFPYGGSAFFGATGVSTQGGTFPGPWNRKRPGNASLSLGGSRRALPVGGPGIPSPVPCFTAGKNGSPCGGRLVAVFFDPAVEGSVGLGEWSFVVGVP